MNYAFAKLVLSCQPRVTATSGFVYKGLIFDRSLVYRINTQVIYRFGLAQVEISLNNCKQNITSLLLLVGTTIVKICRCRLGTVVGW